MVIQKSMINAFHARHVMLDISINSAPQNNKEPVHGVQKNQNLHIGYQMVVGKTNASPCVSTEDIGTLTTMNVRLVRHAKLEV